MLTRLPGGPCTGFQAELRLAVTLEDNHAPPRRLSDTTPTCTEKDPQCTTTTTPTVWQPTCKP